MYSLFLIQIVTEQVDVAPTLRSCVQKVRSSNPDRYTDSPGVYAVLLGLLKQIRTLSDVRSSYFYGMSVTSVMFCKSELKTCVCVCVCIQGSPVEIQNPTHWNLIGHSLTGTPPVLSPSSILRTLFSDCLFISTRKNLPH